tara:strand:- start:2941 stop:5226 length:2286 start_codon:yes stop_codon:yes gene_type:complete
MTRPSKKGPSGLIRRGTYGLALVLPLFASFVSSKPYKKEITFKPLYKNNSSFQIAQSIGVENSEENGLELPQLSNQWIEKALISSESILLAEDPRYLIAEVLIEGLENHPEEKRLQYAAYDAMSIRPGSKVSREDVKRDLEAIYSTGWFSGVNIDPVDTPLGIGIIVKVEPNPALTKIEISPINSKLDVSTIDSIFRTDYGKTLNLNILQLRMKELKNWYLDAGYSLARITGPNRITPEGVVLLKVQEGKVEGIDIEFINQEGESIREDGKKVRGKTRDWVIKREMSTKPGDVFNRKNLEADIKRLYSTSLFSDLKVTLNPVAGQPGTVRIKLGVTEQKTGSLTGGLGYSGSQGVFGQAGLQESNLLGRSWTSNMSFSYGEFGGLINLSLSDPWIKGDKYRTSFRTSLFLSREVPTELRSRNAGHIKGVSDRYEPSGSYTESYELRNNGITGTNYSSVNKAKIDNNNVSWFDYEGDSIVLERKGYGFSFARPMNGGDPFKKVPWTTVIGMNFQNVRPINYAGANRPYGVATDYLRDHAAPKESIICVSYNCAEENTLFSLKGGATYNNLNDARNPTSGNYLSFVSEQYLSLGDNSPTFNRARVGYSYFIPINLLKLHKGCRPKSNEKFDCAQTIGFQTKSGTIIGDLPPYEAFCLGGTSSVRGWSNCDLGVGRSFGEVSVEYRFPIWRIVSGALFADAGTDFGSQADVPGKPGDLLKKPGSGMSVGSGVVVNTPVGPIRLEVASQGFVDDWRYNLGVGWKF